MKAKLPQHWSMLLKSLDSFGSLTSRKLLRFRLFDTAIVGASLAIVFALSVNFLTESPESKAAIQLEDDVRALNAAIEVHVIFEGPLETAANAGQALDGLKAADRIDASLFASVQDAQEASTRMIRATWDPSRNRFKIARSGAPGVKAFYEDVSPLASAGEGDSSTDDAFGEAERPAGALRAVVSASSRLGVTVE